MVATAKGSGKPGARQWPVDEQAVTDIRKTSRLYSPSAAMTGSGQYWVGAGLARWSILVTRRLGSLDTYG